MSYIDKSAIIEQGVEIYPNNTIIGRCVIKQGTILYPNNIIIDSTIGQNCTLTASVIKQCSVGDNVNVGPNANLRNNTIVENDVRIGNFVEIKNSVIGEGTKIAHLTYVGDAQIGKNCNLGCGVVFCNYDGKYKHKTIVGNNVFIGSNVNLIAPITLGDNSFVAAGSTITKSIEKDIFSIARAKQIDKPKRE